jgi:pseudomonalisin
VTHPKLRPAAALTTGLLLVPLAAGVAQAGAATPAAGKALVSTATKAADVGRAVSTGALPAGQEINLDITLKTRNAGAELAALKAMYTPGSATYHHFLTPAQFDAAFGPTVASVNQVKSFLSAHHFTNISVLSNRMMITARATAANAESAFATKLSQFKVGSLGFYANTAPASVPASLSSAILAVVGLNDIPMAMPHPARASASQRATELRELGKSADPTSANFPEAIPPVDFQNTYDAAKTPTGAHTAIAILTEGDISGVFKDLGLAEKASKLPGVSYTEIPVGPQSTDTSGLDEFDLDTQTSTAMAETVKQMYLYNIGQLVDTDLDLGFAEFYAQDKAPVMSASIGGCDTFPYLDGSMVSNDQLGEEGALQGQSLFASTGDTGDACLAVVNTGAPTGAPGVNWPADGEFVLGVGGTSLIADSKGNRVEEIGWLGGGGGYSEVENPGFWTQASNPGYSLEYVNGGRAIPDMALNADPNFTAIAIYVNGQIEDVGGTSEASPMMMGVWARLESAHNNQLGFAPIDLYGLYDSVNPGTAPSGSPLPVIIPSASPSGVPGLTDITLGTNGIFFARPGYDEVTGLGAPEVAALMKATLAYNRSGAPVSGSTGRKK